MSSSNIVLACAIISSMIILAPGHTPYNSITQICCNGHVTDRGDSSTVCCGSRAIDPKQSKCCFNNQVVDIPANGNPHHYSCCYDENTESSVLYNTQDEFCCVGVKSRNGPDGCCGREVYDRNSHFCCVQQDEATIQQLINNSITYCCGQERYNCETHMCCEDEVLLRPNDINRGSDYICCGKDVYDIRTQMCCAQEGEDQSVEYAIRDINWNITPTSCCGTSIYNAKKQQWIACCGGQTITSPSTQLCIKDKIFDRDDYYFSVCSDTVYDIRTYLCCGGVMLDRVPGMICCPTAGQPYNSTTHLCCGDEVVAMTTEDVDAGNDACCTTAQPASA